MKLAAAVGLGLVLSVTPLRAAHEGETPPPGCRVNDPVDTAGVEPPKTPPQLLASALHWRGFFGIEGLESEMAYVLVDRDFLNLPGEGTPGEDDALDAAIKAWMETHPDARVVPVEFSAFGKNVGFTYAWLVSGAENLNVELVRRGLCQGTKMLVPDGKQEWRVARDEYDRFEAAIRQAELAAIAARAGIWAREDMQHVAHWRRAEGFERQRKFTEAIAEFKLTFRGDANGSSDGSAWLRIARCYDAAGDYPAALLAFDRSAERGDEPPHVWSYFEKAKCISKHEGPDKGAAMLEAVIAASPDDIERYQILAELEYVSRRFARATKALERGTTRFEKRARIRFDDADGIIWESQRVVERTSYLEDAQKLQFEYGRLAEFYLAGGDSDQALRSCARALSIGRKIMSYPAGNRAPAEIEAGDANCRRVRAQIFMNRGSLAAARGELDHVKVLLDSGYVQGARIEEPFEKLSAELAERMAATNR